jgi:hypothetical protein
LLLDVSVAILLVVMLVGVSAFDRRTPVAVAHAPRIEPVAVAAHPEMEPPPPPQIEAPPEPPAEPDPEPPKITDFTPPPVRPTGLKPTVNVSFSPDLRFGLQALTGNPDDPTDDFKKLTYEVDGGTNNTRVLVDGASPLFFGPQGQPVEGLNTDAEGRQRCAWAFRQVEFEQAVEYVPGDLSQRLDTILVTYSARNDAKAARRVGLRVMLDTLIGENDGVPFIVPGRPGIVQTPQAFHGDDVPDFIRALETGNLAAPGVIVAIGLRTGTGERPSEVILSHWPGSDANWDYDRDEPFGHDTAVGLYYEPKRLEPGETRTIEFTYGLGTISSTRTKNARLSLTSGGQLQSGGKFWLVALVQNPRAGQAVKLTLPAGLSLKETGEARKPVPAGGGFTQVSWLVAAESSCAGDVEVTAALEPDGIQERQVLHIQPREARLRLVARGPFQAGRPFWAVAVVQHPKAGQSMELTLPQGLSLGAGETAKKDVPSSGAHSQVRWLLHADTEAVGVRELKARLEPEGIEERQAITIEPREERLTLVTRGPFQSGRPFWVAVLVEQARAGQSVELTLPPGLVLDPKESARKDVSLAGEQCQVNWLVRTKPGTSGKQPLTVTLQPTGRQKSDEVDIEAGNLIR